VTGSLQKVRKIKLMLRRLGREAVCNVALEEEKVEEEEEEEEEEELEMSVCYIC